MTGQRALDPPAAAAAAARRLSSSRPLFAVSLSTAVSQLLQLTAIPESVSLGSPSQFPSSFSSSQVEDDALGSDNLTAEDGPSGHAAENQQPHPVARAATDQEVTETFQTQWLTARFIAQVRAHFETTLAASSEEDGEVAENGGEETQASEEEEAVRYQRAVCTGALRWGLLLLLSAEPALLNQQAPRLASPTTPRESPEQQSDSYFSSEMRRPQAEALSGNRHDNAESADAVLREALFAFEIIVRVSPSMATRILPKVLEWLDWGLSGTGGHHPLLSEGTEASNKQIHILDAHLQHMEAVSGECPLERRVQQIRKGSLSALFTCPLPNYVASGCISSTSEHLNRNRPLSGTLLLNCGSLEGLSDVEKMILAACLPPVLRWVAAPSQHNTAGGQTGGGSASSASIYPEHNFSWAFVGTHCVAAESAPRKAALYILATIQGVLLSFALNVQGSSKCLDTFGVAAAATDKSVVRQAQAKELPKAFQANANRADSRILLTATTAASVVEVQIAERGGGGDPRCPLTGRLQLPYGLPDEQLTELFPGQMASGHSAMHGGGERVLLSYLSDEGASLMAIHVSRVLIALVKSVSLGDEERSLGFIIPPLLRVLDVPQAEVRFLGWKCLNEVVVKCPIGGLNNYRTPIMQALMGGFPIYTEVEVCFDAYLEAFTTFICRTFVDEYDQSFFDCQNFLIDMCYPALHSSESLSAAFLKRSRALLIFAPNSANLRLCDWMGSCLEALESVSLETIEEGLQTLKVLLSIGIDIEEFLPQILCRLATIAIVAKEESVRGCPGPCSGQPVLAESVESVARQLLHSADNELLSSICTNVSSHFQERRSDEPSLVDAITKWLSWFSSLLQEGHAEAKEKRASPMGCRIKL
ncbi:LOW QUALITY PROTEIN: uncharacterized protein EMH_0003010 [Eimeria mitis]|uniref:Uncharacterized protein n=1 Tax=Eimeria mitis TaxID=44415 RepID=U6JUL9_9EIME|nr:LOW QUALITY PROTEIN: uncharacterized protein EMH_0003010 [Eimeria mitis]CDJ29109.1 hypothetical protein, conserved [Eimeria mitis]